MADVQSQMILQRLDQIKKNQAIVRQKQYSYRYDVGELALRWTANPKVGVYGKLAYKLQNHRTVRDYGGAPTQPGCVRSTSATPTERGAENGAYSRTGPLYHPRGS